MMKRNDLLLVLLGPLPVVLVPLVAMQVSDEWHWKWPAFVLLWGLLASAIFAYKVVTRRNDKIACRLAAGLAIVTGFLLMWSNLAVGLIGSEDNPANLMYGGVFAVGGLGAMIARFQPRGMANTLFLMALMQLLVPILALLFWPSDFSPGVVPVFILNAVFALLFAGSAVLFRLAAEKPQERIKPLTGR